MARLSGPAVLQVAVAAAALLLSQPVPALERTVPGAEPVACPWSPVPPGAGMASAGTSCNLWSADLLHALAHGLRQGQPGALPGFDTLDLTAGPAADAGFLARYARGDYRCLVTGAGVPPGVPAPAEASRRRRTLVELYRSDCEPVPSEWGPRIAEVPPLWQVVGLMLGQFQVLAQELTLLIDEEQRLGDIFGKPYQRPMVPNPQLGFTDEVVRLSNLAVQLAATARQFLAPLETGSAARLSRLGMLYQTLMPSPVEWAGLSLEQRMTALAGLVDMAGGSAEAAGRRPVTSAEP